MTDSVDTDDLEAIANRRKLQLKVIREKCKPSANQKSVEDGSLPKPKFRNYKPQDENLQQFQVESEHPSTIGEGTTQKNDDKEPNNQDQDALDFKNLVPRQIDWDIKRDISKKLEKLERRTEKAIAELIRERLKQDPDLAQVPSN